MSKQDNLVDEPRPGPVAEHDDQPPKEPVRIDEGRARRPGPVTEDPASKPRDRPDDSDDDQRPG